MTGLSGSESEDLDAVSTDSGDPRPYSLSQSSGALPAGDPTLAAGAGGEADIREYGRTLGVDVQQDPDLLWLVHEAFVASLPPSWTEYYDEDGRVYFYSQVTRESSWSHPMDKVFKEIIDLVKALRSERPPASKARRSEAVQAHLQAVHERAMASLDGWSGPYTSDSGTYFYNASLEVSVWDNPVDEWQGELALRQQVLHRCLLADISSGSARSADGRFEGGGPGLTEAALTRLPLGLSPRNRDESAPAPVPQSPGSARSARSFLSARSTCTARSLTPTRARSREWPRPNPDGSQKPPPSGPAPVPGAESPRKRLAAASEAASSEVPRCSPLDELAQSEQKAQACESGAGPACETPDELASAAQGRPQAEAQARESGAGPSCDTPDELASAAQGTSQVESSVSATSSEVKATASQASREAKGKHEVPPRKARSVSPSKRPPLPTQDRPTAASSARAATEDDDSDSLEFTFGRTAPVSLPKFGT